MLNTVIIFPFALNSISFLNYLLYRSYLLHLISAGERSLDHIEIKEEEVKINITA